MEKQYILFADKEVTEQTLFVNVLHYLTEYNEPYTTAIWTDDKPFSEVLYYLRMVERFGSFMVLTEDEFNQIENI